MPRRPRTHRPRKVQRQERPSACKRGYDRDWQEYSIIYRINHPFCIQCFARGRIVPAAHVDHIQPVTGPADPLFWDETNHQSLCASCHSAKTIIETRQGANTPGGADSSGRAP
jgi:5-methylcytosine-specific restriction protein A